MIEFLGRNEIPTPDRVLNKFVFGTLPLPEYRAEAVGAPTYVRSGNKNALRGNPVRMNIGDNGQHMHPVVVTGEVHEREIGRIRIICDTLEEVVALADTRRPIEEIIRKHAGYIDAREISSMIESVYADVKAAFAGPASEASQPQARPALGETMMNRIASRLAESAPKEPAFRANIEAVDRKPSATFGKRMGF